MTDSAATPRQICEADDGPPTPELRQALAAALAGLRGEMVARQQKQAQTRVETAREAVRAMESLLPAKRSTVLPHGNPAGRGPDARRNHRIDEMVADWETRNGRPFPYCDLSA